MTRTIIAILGLTIAIAVFFLYTKPTYDDAKAFQTTISEYNGALEKASELQRLKQALLSRYNAFNPSDIDRLHKLLPDHVDNVRLVLDLDNIAQRYGLALQNVVVGAPSQTTAAPAGAIGSTDAFDSLTFKFSTEGTYANFVRFMEDLERSLRIVDLVTLTMSNTGSGQNEQQNAKGPPVEPTYRFDVTVKTYWLK
ncbi:type 4a pilus biogenesis protein PilO [Candidatus Kaiserbacteria bacterium]|nr:type 4a pilus biogenesis protein PilO [Candidatus Kaiserbacteria bacterium]